MSKLCEWLESKQADLVSSLEVAIAKRPDARQLTHQQVSALVLALSVALEKGPAVLETLLQQWNQETVPDSPPTGKWTVALAAVREELWSSVISEFSPVKALTHLKALESLLVQTITLAASLDQQQQLRTLEQELQQAREWLKQLEQSKADFISVAAHELKTPLTLIEGYVNMLMDDLPEETRSKTDILLGGVANGTRRLREIIESLIDISMIDTELLDVSFQPIYLRHITNMAARALSDVFRIRQIELIVDKFPDDGVPTYGDPERLHQAIFNVLGNAIKYTPDGGRIEIHNSVHPPDDETEPNLRGCLEIKITDSGIGIAAENLERIFDRFAGLGSVALHSTSKYKFKGGGPGLGLAITRGIIEAHGGKVWAESEGCDDVTCPGSIFHIFLPLLDAPPDH